MRALGRLALPTTVEAAPAAPAPPAFLVSWPVAAFAGLLAGILVAFSAWWGALFLLVPLLAWRAAPPWSLLAVAVTAALLGGARERAWMTSPDALASWQGALVTLRGEWDGQFLTLHEPRARVALSPKPDGGAGPLVVRGRLTAPPERRNPGGFDYRFWLQARGVHAVLSGAQVLERREEGGARGWFRRGLRAGLPEREGALMQAIQLGDEREAAESELRGGLSTRDAFARAGLAHLMALSGQNVALLVAVVTWLLARTRVSLWRYPLMIALLFAYLQLVGATPSVTRAVLMGAAVLLGLWVGRGKLDVLGTLGLAGSACLLLYPLWVFDVGFQLSFLAVLALTLTPRLEARLPSGWPRWLKFGVAGTLLAELGTLPVIAHHFGLVPLVGLPANLLAAPLMAALVPLGFLAGLLGPLSVPVNWLVLPLAQLLLGVAGLFGQVPPVPWGNIGPAGFVAYGVFALTLVLWLLRRLRAWQLALVALLCALGTALPSRLNPPREIVYLDVGQGDSTLLRLGHQSVLIDGGGTPRSDYDVGAGTVVPALRALGVHDLEIVVATHADLDHVEGLVSVLKHVRVGELWLGQRSDDAAVQALLAVAAARGVPVREVRRGDVAHLGRATLTVLWPPGEAWRAQDNENSVALTLQDGAFRAAFLGDVPVELEARLGVGPVDVLKVAHHGSRFSTGDALLLETAARDAVISVGRNTYGHPHPDVLQRLAARRVRVWRTDQVGALRWPLP